MWIHSEVTVLTFFITQTSRILAPPPSDSQHPIRCTLFFISSFHAILFPTLVHSPFHVIFIYEVPSMSPELCLSWKCQCKQDTYIGRWKQCPLMPISKHLTLWRRISLHSTRTVIAQFPTLKRPKNAQHHKKKHHSMANNLLRLEDGWTVFPMEWRLAK